MRKRTKMKTALIIANGEIRDYGLCRRLIRKADYVICADGGLTHARKMKIEPDMIIGDFDSVCLQIANRRGHPLKARRYEKDKNRSDTELAVRQAARMGFRDIIVLGALGKRADHAIANIYVAGLFPGKVTILDELTQIKVAQSSFSIEGKRGDTISLLPFMTAVSGINAGGLKYPLKNATLALNSRGLSNVMTGSKAHGTIKRGKLLIIKVRQDE